MKFYILKASCPGSFIHHDVDLCKVLLTEPTECTVVQEYNSYITNIAFTSSVGELYWNQFKVIMKQLIQNFDEVEQRIFEQILTTYIVDNLIDLNKAIYADLHGGNGVDKPGMRNYQWYMEYNTVSGSMIHKTVDVIHRHIAIAEEGTMAFGDTKPVNKFEWEK